PAGGAGVCGGPRGVPGGGSAIPRRGARSGAGRRGSGRLPGRENSAGLALSSGAGGGGFRSRGGAPLLPRRVCAAAQRQRADDVGGTATGGALPAIAVAAEGARVGGQPLSALEPAPGLRAAEPGGLPGFSHRGAGGAESLEGHVPGVPSRSGGRVPPAARAPAAVPLALDGGGGAVFSRTAVGTEIGRASCRERV